MQAADRLLEIEKKFGTDRKYGIPAFTGMMGKMKFQLFTKSSVL
jgi:hypothetical protein